MWTIGTVINEVRSVLPETSIYVLDEIHEAILHDDARMGVPADKVLWAIVWYSRQILNSPEASPEEKLATIAVIRCVEIIWPTGFKALKGRL